MIRRGDLYKLYVTLKKSAKDIALTLNCSENQVNYWLLKYKIQKRSISEALYLKKNPQGHPFKVPKRIKMQDYMLYGLGIGLFWGEGYKKSKNSVRLGNTDPYLIRAFILFLERIFKIEKTKLRFGIQIFQDLDKDEVRKYWMRVLRLKMNQVYPTVVISKSFKKGTYKLKNKYGVITVYFNNTHLKGILDGHIEKMKEIV